MAEQEKADPRLEKLVEGVVRLATGDLSARMEPSGSRDAVDAVITGVNLLAEELQHMYQDLEDRVEQRTAMLQEAQAELHAMAMRDALTGLANRALLAERVAQALQDAGDGSLPPALMMLDLDSFKAINDSLGHVTGDEVLVEVGRRLAGIVRATDTVARLGGDEFAILVPRATEDAVNGIAHRALESLQHSIEVGTVSVWAPASIGVRIGRAGESFAQLMRDADIAMYRAKSRGRNNVQIFHPRMLDASQERSRVAAELRSALGSDQLQLHYQPIVELRTGRITGVEALVRWQHPDRGAISPEAFINVAEDTGLIVDLGRWVLHEAVSQVQRWDRQIPFHPPFRLHINLSATELQRADLVSDLRSTLDAHGIDPSRLILEITETVLMTREAEETQTLAELLQLGVGVDIDDFGTGYSSISYLRSLPVDTVKVDQSLIAGMGTDPEQRGFVGAVLQLIAAAGLQAIAEGIETAEQAEQLSSLGCAYGQGYFFGRPGPAAQLGEMLRAQSVRR